MALGTEYLTRSGVPVKAAYVRVTDLHIGRHPDGLRLAFRAAAFADETLAQQAHLTVEEPRGYQCPYNLDGPNPFEQAYNWLAGEDGPFPGAKKV